MEPRRRPRSVFAAATLAMAMFRMLLWCSALRARLSRPIFERAWLAAWSSGWRLENLLSPTERDRIDLLILRLAWPVWELAQRMAPPTGPRS